MKWWIPPVGTLCGTSLLLASLSLPLFATAQSVAIWWLHASAMPRVSWRAW